MEYQILLNETEQLGLQYVATNPQEWVESVIHHRARKATDEIIDIVIKYCLDNNIQVPSTREEIIKYGFDNKIVKTAKERDAENQVES